VILDVHGDAVRKSIGAGTLEEYAGRAYVTGPPVIIPAGDPAGQAAGVKEETLVHGKSHALAAADAFQQPDRVLPPLQPL
jgi:hypothetical protein